MKICLHRRQEIIQVKVFKDQSVSYFAPGVIDITKPDHQVATHGQPHLPLVIYIADGQRIGHVYVGFKKFKSPRHSPICAKRRNRYRLVNPLVRQGNISLLADNRR
ncbi:hypothetical protein D3C76_918210 [compost metagenome]